MSAASQPDSKQLRARQLAAIHIAKGQLDMDRDVYEALLQRVAGVTSSAKLDVVGRVKVLEEFRRLGAARPAVTTRRGKARPGQYPGRPSNYASNAMPDMITKIEAQLADMKLTWSYADSIAKRMFGVEKVAWVRKPEQLKALIAALDVEQTKRDRNDAVDSLVTELGLSSKDLAELTANMPKAWRRNRKCLAAVIDHLSARAIKKQQLEAPDGH